MITNGLLWLSLISTYSLIDVDFASMFGPTDSAAVLFVVTLGEVKRLLHVGTFQPYLHSPSADALPTPPHNHTSPLGSHPKDG